MLSGFYAMRPCCPASRFTRGLCPPLLSQAFGACLQVPAITLSMLEAALDPGPKLPRCEAVPPPAISDVEMEEAELTPEQQQAAARAGERSFWAAGGDSSLTAGPRLPPHRRSQVWAGPQCGCPAVAAGPRLCSLWPDAAGPPLRAASPAQRPRWRPVCGGCAARSGAPRR